MKTHTAPWDYARFENLQIGEYKTPICPKCAALCIYHNGWQCKECGTVEAVLLPESQLEAFRSTFAMVEGLKAAVAIVHDPDMLPTIEAMNEMIRNSSEPSEYQKFTTMAEKYAPQPLAFYPVETCDHKREHAVIGGMRCPTCGRTREAENDFERSMISRLTPRGNGYVHYKF